MAVGILRARTRHTGTSARSASGPVVVMSPRVSLQGGCEGIQADWGLGGGGCISRCGFIVLVVVESRAHRILYARIRHVRVRLLLAHALQRAAEPLPSHVLHARLTRLFCVLACHAHVQNGQITAWTDRRGAAPPFKIHAIAHTQYMTQTPCFVFGDLLSFF